MSLLHTYFQPLGMGIISHILYLQLHCISACHVYCPITNFVRRISPTVHRHFSSVRLCQQSYCRGAGVRPSINSGFSETSAWIQAKIYRKLTIHHIFRHFFFLNIHFSHKFSRLFFFVFVNMGPIWKAGSKNFKMLFLLRYLLYELMRVRASAVISP